MDKKVIHSVFEDVASRHAFSTAIETGSESISYSVLNTFANRLAHGLRSVGVGKGRIVQVIIPSSIELVAAMLGVFKASAVYLPVDLNFSPKRLHQVYTETYEGIIITTASLLDRVIEMAQTLDIEIEQLIVIGDNHTVQLYTWSRGALDARPFVENLEWEQNIIPLTVNGDDSNYIFYTSGSTGDGKAILGKHAGVSHFVHWEIKEFGLGENVRTSQLAAFTFDASLRDIFTALLAGGTLCIPAADVKNHPALLLAWIEQSKITLLHCVPSLFRILIKQLQQDAVATYNLSSLQYLVLAGELLYAKDILAWRKAAGNNTRLINFYGPTETTLIKTFYRIGEVPDNPSAIMPVGVPIGNTSVAIVKNGQLCGVGDIGEIYIKTPFATKGYYNNKQLTDEVFVQNPLTNDSNDLVYKTGDMGRYLADGNIEVLGRLDSQVKVNGIRVELSEIEKAMLGCEHITGAVAKVHRSDDNLSTLIAYYTGRELPPEELGQQLSRSLNQQLIPSFFVYLDKFPVNINGKIDRKALPVPEDILFNDINFEPPAGEVEHTLVALWKEILGIKKIGRNISFFSIGGHSLRAIQLISRIHKEFNVSLKIADVFNNRTVKELAVLVTQGRIQQYRTIPVVEEQTSYPLSSSQRRLWVLGQLDEGNKAYNISGVYVFEGLLDREALSFSLNALIDRHEILRTIFTEADSGTIRQVVQPASAVNFAIRYHDLRNDGAKEEKVQEQIHLDCTAAFDLSKGPLLRSGLYQVEDHQWIFTYVMHHIISDGWSMNVLIKELLDLYNGYVQGIKTIKEPLRIQYKDYASWQNQLLSDPSTQANKAYWLQQFSGELPVLDLAGDRPRPPVKSYAGLFINKTIPSETVTRLHTICQEEGCTFFMALVAIVKTLLYRYTGQQDIVIGSPVAGREHLDLEDQIGFYVNTLPLRTQVSGEESFRSLLQKVKEVTLKAYEHQAYPFDELVNNLHLQRDMGRHPLFDIVVVLQNTQTKTITTGQVLDKLSVSNYPEQGVTSKFDLTFNFLEQEEGLQVHIEYNTDLYRPATIERLAGHLCRLTEELITYSHLPVDEQDYLPAEEKHQLLVDFNSTASLAPVHKTVITLFEEQVEHSPGRIALMAGDNKLTYRTLNERANKLAGYLRKHYQLDPGDLVALKLERNEWLITSILGILKTGAAYLPVDPEYPESRIKYILEDSGAKVLFDQAELAKFRETENEYSTANAAGVNTPGDLVYVLYTSGSTGTPKGVMVEHKSVVRLVKNASYVSLTGEEVLLSTGAVSFDAVTFEYWSMLLNGGALVICSEETLLNPALLAKEISDKKVDTMWFTAGWLNQLVETDIGLFKGLKTLLAGGDKLSPAHINLLLEQYPDMKIINGYGPTENTTFSLTYPITTPSNNIPIGKPIDHSTAYIVDHNGRLVPVGVMGEICMGGLGVARGYLNNDALTREKFIENPFVSGEYMYRSGDLGRWLADGNIEFTGRKDDQVKVRGYRIEPGEVEIALQQEPGIASAVVIAKANEQGVRELIAYIVSREPLQVPALRSSLGKRLPAYMLPQHFVQMDMFPLTANGKVDKRKLPDPVHPGIATGVQYVAARNDREKQLTEVYEEVLRKGQVSIKDDFFVLGGDSIKSIQVASRLKQRGYAVSIQAIMMHPVIEELAQYLKPVNRAVEQDIVQGIVPLGPIQYSFLQSDQPEKHHFNQAVLLESDTPLVEGTIRRVLDTIVLHHDALRMTYNFTEAGWVQEVQAHQQHNQYQLEVVQAGADDDLTAHCDRVQAGFNLSKGPLLKALLYKEETKDLLLIAIHHLVVDGVSWRILLEDIAALYQQYSAGAASSLPPKTDPFKRWQEQQWAYAKSGTLSLEDAWWSAIAAAPKMALPIDHPEGRNLVEDSTAQSFLLDKELTGRLLTKCYKAYHTEINDILLAALGMALQLQFGMEQATIFLEGHGREQIGTDIDVSRTVGWFTSMYPVLLKMNAPGDIVRQLIDTKETLHSVPNKGIGFGILQYLVGKDYTISPAITFNYLGDFGSGVSHKEGPLFRFSEKDAGKLTSGKRQRESTFDITGIIVNDCLQISIAYSTLQYAESTIRSLLLQYRQSLHTIIDALSAIPVEYMTPADLRYKEIDIDQWLSINREGDIEDIYPLSPLQEGMYYQWLRYPGATAFLEQMSFKLQGQLDKTVLERSYQQLVARHTILRTFFRNDLGDTMLQVVQRNGRDAFVTIDMTALAPEAVEAFKAEDIARGFDLQAGPLMRLSVLCLGHDTYELVWSHHHILMDGWCVGILIREFFEIYYGIVAGHVPVLRTVYPYADYIGWLQRADKQLALQYWKKYLEGCAAVTGIPRLHTQPGGGYQPCKISLTLSAGTQQLIRSVCREAGVTENIFFQAVWAILLSKYNNTPDVTVGTVVSGRPAELEGVEEMIGLFINTVPLRVQLKEEQSFLDLLRAIQLQAIHAAPYHYSLLADVQQQSELAGEVFDHVLVFENYPVQQMVEQDVQTSHVLTFSASDTFEHTNYDLSVLVLPRETTEISFSWNGLVYEAWQMEKLKDHLHHLIGQVVEDASLPATVHGCLSSTEQQEILAGFNGTDTPYPGDRTIMQLIEDQVQRSPDDIALVFEQTTLTFQALNEQANLLGHHLRKLHAIEPDDIIGIQLPRSEWCVIAMLGVLKSGAACLMIDPEYPAARTKYMTQDCQCKVVIDEETLEAYRRQWDDALNFDPGNINGPGDLAAVIYTSGSTGNPKGVALQHKGIINHLFSKINTLSLGPDSIICHNSELHFVGGIWQLLAPLVTGGKAVLCNKNELWDIDQLLQKAAAYKTALLEVIPSQLNDRLAQGDLLLPASIETLILTGEKLNSRFVEKCFAGNPGLQIINTYGQTEFSDVTCSWSIPRNSSHANVLAGKPIQNTRIYVLSPEGAVCPAGVTGEVCTSGDGLSRGYINDPELTRKKYVPDPFRQGERMYRTGDLGRWWPDGTLEVLGRIDQQVKIRGFRVEIAEVENALNSLPGITTSLVLATVGQQGENELVAYVVAKEFLIVTEIREALGKLLPMYMLPAHVVQLEQLHLMPNGKVDKSRLPKPGVADSDRAYVAPGSKTERQLAGIWEQVLQRTGIGVKDNFFELGGHSLKVTRLANRIYKDIGVKMGLQELFTIPVLENQAILIQERSKMEYAGIRPAPVQEAYPVSSSQHRLWIMSQFEEANLAYNIPGFFYFEGVLDPVLLKNALQATMERHEILRTAFRDDGHGLVKQYILPSPAVPLELTVIDLRNDPLREDTVSALAKQDVATPFNLESPPLFRARLYQLEDQKWAFTYVIHHIVSDDWSIDVLMKELIAVYSAAKKGAGHSLPALNIQYKDYAAWQQSFLNSQALQQQQAYWLSQFTGQLPVLELPAGRPRPAVKTYNGAAINRSISSGTCKSFKALLNKESATLFMGLVAAVNTLLHKLSGQEDIILGSPVAGRDHIELENQVGFYVNTIALRTRFNGADSFHALLQSVKQVVLDAYDHQAYPFDALVDLLGLTRDPSRNFLFDAWLVLHNTNMEDPQQQPIDTGFKVSRFVVNEKVHAKFDVLFSFNEADDQLFLDLEYNTDIFTRQEAVQMSEWLEHLLAGVAQQPDESLLHINAAMDQVEKEAQQAALQKIRVKNLSDLKNKHLNHAK